MHKIKLSCREISRMVHTIIPLLLFHTTRPPNYLVHSSFDLVAFVRKRINYVSCSSKEKEILLASLFIFIHKHNHAQLNKPASRSTFSHFCWWKYSWWFFFSWKQLLILHMLLIIAMCILYCKLTTNLQTASHQHCLFNVPKELNVPYCSNVMK